MGKRIRVELKGIRKIAGLWKETWEKTLMYDQAG